MKHLCVAFILSLIISSFANAKVISIADWDPGMTSRTNSKTPEEETLTDCAEQCPGYSISVTICPVYGETQVSCPVAGCEHYYRCVKNY